MTGCAVITLDRAYLFTDGRYYLQAEKQLDESVPPNSFTTSRDHHLPLETGP
jgi:hypothetical protein